MDIEAKKQLVRRYYEEIVSTGAVEQISRFISPNYVEVHDHKTFAIGLSGAKDHILGVRKTYPDLRLTVEQQIGCTTERRLCTSFEVLAA